MGGRTTQTFICKSHGWYRHYSLVSFDVAYQRHKGQYLHWHDVWSYRTVIYIYIYIYIYMCVCVCVSYRRLFTPVYIYIYIYISFHRLTHWYAPLFQWVKLRPPLKLDPIQYRRCTQLQRKRIQWNCGQQVTALCPGSILSASSITRL